ncbi:hypothetical protein [Kitasatospora sp. NPDC093558]|uniref:hypothetical protein n=1 Tax=Kitasatospora sp. NPDC093558 TaxID=3155201 RepID=UPI00342E770A
MKGLKAVLGTGIAAAALAATTLAGAGTARADTWEQCPEDSVCIYIEGQPMMVFHGYGAHDLVGAHGAVWLVNTLVSGKVSLCHGLGGVDCASSIGPGWYYIGLDTITSFVITV